MKQGNQSKITIVKCIFMKQDIAPFSRMNWSIEVWLIKRLQWFWQWHYSVTNGPCVRIDYIEISHCSYTEQGPISPTIFYVQFDSMENLFCCNSIWQLFIAVNFSLWVRYKLLLWSQYYELELDQTKIIHLIWKGFLVKQDPYSY